MIRSFRQIIGTPVMDTENGSPLALIRDIIIHPDTGKIEAFWVKPLTLPLRDAVITSDSILEWKKNIYIKGEGEIAEPDEIIRIAEILSRNTYFIKNQVRSESGEALGWVEDLDFDTGKLYLRNLYTAKSFFGFKYSPRVFSYDAIIKALPEYVLVKDMEEKRVKEGVLVEDKRPLLDV